MMKFLRFTNACGRTVYRPVSDIWKIATTDSRHCEFQVVFHRASGDFDTELLTKEELADVVTLDQIVNGGK